MSVTFVNLHGLPVRIARIRSFIPSSRSDFDQRQRKFKADPFLADPLDQTSFDRWDNPSCLNIWIPKIIIQATMYFQTDWSKLRSAAETASFAKGGRAMIIRNIPGKAQCPACGSENVKFQAILYHHHGLGGLDSGSPDCQNLWEEMLGVWPAVSGISEMRCIYDGRMEGV